ncbi:F0F1 ATP synthase subunit epsilon [Xanthobacter agilis]|uniref:ATP synthase epsilon chain n=1 Tax=Xanthobacter agilis TaxID=47492 RepID=A0ABU0LEZ7_XANAG|nr:F0F1 ATP synthase subunit epsilon [Xanthobacter agilis]MDQ0505720.1 F-type H+-transporting ATPase subunit epsilon [Xanthobacter agilis]
MSRALTLTITTPTRVLVAGLEVRAVRAEDESGSFGLLPGHTDFLTVLPASVLRWRTADDVTHYCAQGGGLLTVEGGTRVAVACRQGTLGDDLARLEEEVERLRAAETDIARKARVEQMRLHANAVRQLMRFLRPARPGTFGAVGAEAATTDADEVA